MAVASNEASASEILGAINHADHYLAAFLAYWVVILCVILAMLLAHQKNEKKGQSLFKMYFGVNMEKKPALFWTWLAGSTLAGFATTTGAIALLYDNPFIHNWAAGLYFGLVLTYYALYWIIGTLLKAYGNDKGAYIVQFVACFLRFPAVGIITQIPHMIGYEDEYTAIIALEGVACAWTLLFEFIARMAILKENSLEA